MSKAPTVITVDSTKPDHYGNLMVTDSLGNVTKIGDKRAHLFELFVPGRVVKLIWDNYKNKDYVSDAELFDGEPPPEKQIKPITAGVAPKQDTTKEDWAEKDRITRKSIERQTALNNAVAVAKLLETTGVTTAKIIATAKLFEAYLEGNPLVEEAKRLGATKGEEPQG